MESVRKMKRYKHSVVFGLLVMLMFGLYGCADQLLEEELFSEIPLDQYYSNQGEVDLAMNGVYASLTDEGSYRSVMLASINEVSGGILRGGDDPNGSGDKSNQSTQWNNFTWSSDAQFLDFIWGTHYDGINEANTLLNKLPESNISEDLKDWYEGQTKFLRGLMYFNLVLTYGDVPLHVEPTLNLDDINKSRTSASEIYSQIESDLQDAESLLSPFSEEDHNQGRATSAAAKALLAKVHLQQREWSEAATKAKEVIDMGVFDLYDDYNDIFRPGNGTGSIENIYSIPRGGTANATGNVYFAKAIYAFGPPATNLPDGTSIKFHDSPFAVSLQVDQEFFENTPDTYRKQQTMRDVMPYYFVGSQMVQNSAQLYAPFVTKFRYLVGGNTPQLHEGVPTILLRYSDVLLTYAEAVNEANGGPTSEAYEAINQVRRRARAVGTPNEQPESVYPDLSGLNQQQFRDAVITERARELIGEAGGDRRQTLLRHDRFIPSAQQRGVNASEDHKVFPLPGGQVDLNPNLEQNPGY